MNEVIITVRGEHQMKVPAEHGIVSLTLSAEGPQRAAVIQRVSELSQPLRTDLAARQTAGTIVEWFSEQVSVRSERPWTDGRYLDPVHYASATFTVIFDDPAELSLWISQVAESEGVQLGHIAWRLTPETAQRLDREVAAKAVRVAVERAESYAIALGKQNVTPLQLADLGLLSNSAGHDQPMARSAQPMMAMAADSVPSAFELNPQDITIAAAVEARFSAT